MTMEFQPASKRKRSPKDRQNKAISLLYTETPITDDDDNDDFDGDGGSGSADRDGGDKEQHSKTKIPKSKVSKLWSEGDEISILEGAIKFKNEKQVQLTNNKAAFYDFVKGSLVLKATRSKVSSKVRRLYNKYLKHVERGRNPKTPHERQVFDLSCKIWAEMSEPKSLQGNDPTETRQPQAHKVPINGTWWSKELIIPQGVLDSLGLLERVRGDLPLVLTAMERLPNGDTDQARMQQLDLDLQSMNLALKFFHSVNDKSESLQMRHSPELLEREVLKLYLEAKQEHAQFLSSAYTTLIKDLGDAA